MVLSSDVRLCLRNIIVSVVMNGCILKYLMSMLDMMLKSMLILIIVMIIVNMFYLVFDSIILVIDEMVMIDLMDRLMFLVRIMNVRVMVSMMRCVLLMSRFDSVLNCRMWLYVIFLKIIMLMKMMIDVMVGSIDGFVVIMWCVWLGMVLIGCVLGLMDIVFMLIFFFFVVVVWWVVVCVDGGISCVFVLIVVGIV